MRRLRNRAQLDTYRIALGGSMWTKEGKVPKYDRLIMWVILIAIVLAMLVLGGGRIADMLP